MVERVMDGLGVDPSVNLRLSVATRVAQYEAREILGNPPRNRTSTITVYQAGTQ